MSRRIFFLCISFLGAALALAIAIPLQAPPNEAVGGQLVFTNVDIINVENGTLDRKQDVFVENGTITQIVETGALSKSGYFEVEGSSKYLMPGLWDMHTHSIKLSPQLHHPLFIANGVTGIRDMSGCLSKPDSFWACTGDRRKWNSEIVSGKRIAPRYPLQSSYQINGGDEVPPGYPHHFRANDITGIPELVAFNSSSGADFLKTYTDISPEAYLVLAEEAASAGLYLAGHRPIRVSLSDAISAGQRSIEHPRLFVFECYAGALEFRRLSNPKSAFDTRMKRRMIDDHDLDICAEKMAETAHSQTYWTPTLQVLSVPARATSTRLHNDPRLKYIPHIVEVGMWKGDVSSATSKTKLGEDVDVLVDLHALAADTVRRAHRSGVKLLVGTDSGDSYIFPGFAVHDELEALMRAGIAPEDALRMATIDAARFAERDARFGTVSVNKAADLILLGANPLENIRNTRSIHGVMLGGRYLDRPALDGMLAYTQQQASSIRTNLQMIWSAITSPLMRVQLAD